MGCDIHAVIQVKINDSWITKEEIFNFRNYEVFAFLAGVRNYSDIEPLNEPKGYPVDFKDERDDRHSASWFNAEELLSIDYPNKTVEDCRCTIQTGPNSYNGGATCEKGKGRLMTLSSFLGSSFMNDIYLIKDYTTDYGKANVRVVFDFDN